MTKVNLTGVHEGSIEYAKQEYKRGLYSGERLIIEALKSVIRETASFSSEERLTYIQSYINSHYGEIIENCSISTNEARVAYKVLLDAIMEVANNA